jgi:hypothetical protein
VNAMAIGVAMSTKSQTQFKIGSEIRPTDSRHKDCSATTEVLVQWIS